MKKQGVAQPGRVSGLEPDCRRFESCRPDHLLLGALLALFLVGCNPSPPEPVPDERLVWTEPVSARDGYAYALAHGGASAVVFSGVSYTLLDLIEPHAPPERAVDGVVYPGSGYLTIATNGHIRTHPIDGLVIDVLDYGSYALITVAPRGEVDLRVWRLDERGLTPLNRR